MADDQLKMVAEVVDKFSGPLRELQKLLKGVHTEQATHTREQTKQNEILDRGLQQTTRNLREGLAPALASVGLQTTTVAGAIGAIVSATAGFGTSIRGMQLLAREAGLSVPALRALEGVADHFQVSSESIEQGAVAWSTAFQQIKRNVGPVTIWLRQQGDRDGGIFSFGEALKHAKSEAEGLDMIFKKLNTIPGASDRRTFLGGLGLPQEWAKMYGVDLPAAMEKWSQTHAAITAETLANAEKWNDAWTDMKQSVTNLRDAIGIELLPGMTKFTDWLRSDFDKKMKESAQIADDFRKALHVDFSGLIGPDDSDQTLKDAIERRDRINEMLGGKPPASTEAPTGDTGAYYGRPFRRRGSSALGTQLPSTSSPQTGSIEIPGLAQAWQKDEAKKGIKEGTSEGVVQGLRDYFTETAGGGGGGGTTQAGGGPFRMAVPSGADPIRAALSSPGSGGLEGGGGSKGGRVPSDLGGGVGGAGGDTHLGTHLTGNAFLQSQRAGFAEELKRNPETRKRLAAIMTLEHESDATAVGESLMNRMAFKGGTIGSGIAGGPRSFYGPARRAGMVEARQAALERDPKRLARMNAAIDAALGGSNLLKGATDQGSGNDPNARWQGGRIMRGGEVYNDWGGGPGGHEGARRFREAQQAQVGRSGGLLKAAEKSGFAGTTHKLEGGASLSIDFRNQPPGTRAWLNTHGNVFDETSVARGKTMQRAADE